MIKDVSCEEYKEQAKGIVDNSLKAAIGVGLVGGFILVAGLAVSDVAWELLSDGWNFLIDCINQDY